MLTGFLNAVILLGALQGFIISCLLFLGKPGSIACRLQAALLFLIASACLTIYLNSQPWYQSNEWLQICDAILPLIMVMPMGPLLYFYIRASSENDFSLSKKYRVHFYPVLIDLLPKLFVLAILVGALLKFYNRLPFNPGVIIDTYNTYADLPRWISLSIYVYASWRYLSGARAGKNTNWLKNCVRVFAAFQVLWFLFLIPYLIPGVGNGLLSLVDWYPIYVPLAVLVYWFGMNGYWVARQSGSSGKSPAGVVSNMPEGQIEDFAQRIIQAVEVDQLYLDADLSLARLSDYTGLSQKQISAILNQHLQTNFNEFINRYRVQAMEARILSEDFTQLSIAGIAMECGFNSVATFQRSFKQVTGLTPSQYRKNSAQIQI